MKTFEEWENEQKDCRYDGKDIYNAGAAEKEKEMLAFVLWSWNEVVVCWWCGVKLEAENEKTIGDAFEYWKANVEGK